MGRATVQMLMRYLNQADDEAIAAHKVNSPADRHHHTKQAGTRRPAMLTVRRNLAWVSRVQRNYLQITHQEGAYLFVTISASR
jgi:hypothetical protein